MINTLSIRSYTRQTRGHSHDFHQIVLPLRGVINIEVASYRGKVTPSECVIVKANETHYFNAEENAKFIVAGYRQFAITYFAFGTHCFFDQRAIIIIFGIFGESVKASNQS